jgi:hypothetical protein
MVEANLVRPKRELRFLLAFDAIVTAVVLGVAVAGLFFLFADVWNRFENEVILLGVEARLPDDVLALVRDDMAAVLVAIRGDLLGFILQVCAAVLVLFVALDLARWSITHFIDRLRQQPGLAVSEFELYSLRRLIVLGIVAALAVGFYLVGWGEDLTLEEIVDRATITVLALSAAGIATYLLSLRAYTRNNVERSLEIGLFLANPQRRLRLWIGLSFTLVLIILFTDVVLPWVVRSGQDSLRQFPEQVAGISPPARRLNLIARCVVHNPTKPQRCRPLHDYFVALDHRAQRAAASLDDVDFPLLIRRLRVILPIVLAWIGIALVLAPLILRPGGFAGFVVRPEGGFGWATVGGAITLPAAFILDRLGVTSFRPMVWLAVCVPFALLDAIAATRAENSVRVFAVVGAERYHRTLQCPSLSRVDESRVHERPIADAQRFGLTACRLCKHDRRDPEQLR